MDNLFLISMLSMEMLDDRTLHTKIRNVMGNVLHGDRYMYILEILKLWKSLWNQNLKEITFQIKFKIKINLNQEYN